MSKKPKIQIRPRPGVSESRNLADKHKPSAGTAERFRIGKAASQKRSKSPGVATTFQLRPEIEERVRFAAVRTKRSLSSIANEAIGLWLDAGGH